jgi:hypothetical protein
MVAILAGCGSSTASTAPTANEAEIASMKLATVEWDGVWKGQCSRHRLDWLAPGVESDLLDDFGQTLDPRAHSRYDRLDDPPKFCGTDERWGQSCDVSVKRRALREMGMLADFAKFACARVVCTEQSDCDRP